MIIGHGDIASVLIDRKDRIYFASGVSNSKEKDESQYQREIDLLMSQDKNKHLVYFSSLCIFYNNNRYAKHKKHIEDLIKKNFKHYTIVRLGNITWGKNPHTLINHFKNQIKNREKLTILPSYRYLVDKDELLHWINMIPDWNCEMNITGKRLKVVEIVNMIKSGDL
jgi:nucleoside-diphosphate-sugar epimerase